MAWASLGAALHAIRQATKAVIVRIDMIPPAKSRRPHRRHHNNAGGRGSPHMDNLPRLRESSRLQPCPVDPRLECASVQFPFVGTRREHLVHEQLDLCAANIVDAEPDVITMRSRDRKANPRG